MTSPMTNDHTITLTLSVEQLLAIPFAGCCHLLEAAAASGSLSAGFIAACHCAEAAGRARWPVLDRLSRLLATATPKA